MSTFLCPNCQKRLSAKEKSAGLKVKCPECGQMMVVPQWAAVGAPDRENRSRLPATSPVDNNNPPTRGLGSPADDTRSYKAPIRSHDSGLTRFLSPPRAEDELGRLGNYRILKVLGHGGMGVVFKAEDPKLKRSVAIKAMLPAVAANASAGQRFLREAQAMAALKHDHVVTIYQVDEEHGVPFLAMEFLAGEALDERLKRDGKLPLPEVLRIGREIAKALAAAHATGLVHRDIKPANIWLEAPASRVKILDFGLARAVTHETGLTQEGAIIGTPQYMAPEQARGQYVDGRCDLFSLGAVLYRLCSGEVPFKGTDIASTLLAVVMAQPEPPRNLNADVPQELSDLVMKLLEKDPARRPASADAVVAALQALENKVGGATETGQHTAADLGTTSATPARRRMPVLFLAVLALMGSLVVGGGALALIIFRTTEGDYVIDTDDPDFAFQVAKGGGVTLTDRKTDHQYQMKVLRQKNGEFDLEVTDPAADLVFQTKTFTIKRGEKPALKAWFERKPAGKLADEDRWLKEVAALPTEKQVKAVMAKMKELNPDFDGGESHVVGKAGVVTELRFSADKVTDISPVRALTGLEVLSCGGVRTFSRLKDITPVKGLKLTEFQCPFSQVADLSPLKDMKLTTLNCGGTPVVDASPLKDMPLTHLWIGCKSVSDLSVLKGMKLTYLDCSGSKVPNLSMVKDMKLTTLGIVSTPISDLSPLKGMPLTFLHCRNTPVTDLSPLMGMPLTELSCTGTKVTDLSPLKGLPLQTLDWDFKPERDKEILRSIETLKTINHKPAKEFWKEVDGKTK